MKKLKRSFALLVTLAIAGVSILQAGPASADVTTDPRISAAAAAFSNDWTFASGDSSTWSKQASSEKYNTFPASYVAIDSSGKLVYDYLVDPIAKSSRWYAILPGVRSSSSYLSYSKLYRELAAPVESGLKIGLLDVNVIRFVAGQVGDPEPDQYEYFLSDFHSAWSSNTVYTEDFVITQNYVDDAFQAQHRYFDLRATITLNGNTISGYDLRTFSIPDLNSYTNGQQLGKTVSLVTQVDTSKTKISAVYNTALTAWLAQTTDTKTRPQVKALATVFMNSLEKARSSGLTLTYVLNKVNATISYNPKTNRETQLDLATGQTTPTYFEADKGEIALGSIWMYMFDLGTNYTGSDVTYNSKTKVYTVKGEDQGNISITLNAGGQIDKITWLNQKNLVWNFAYSTETKKTGPLTSLGTDATNVYSTIIAAVNDQDPRANQSYVNNFAFHFNGSTWEASFDGVCAGPLPSGSLSKAQVIALLKLAGVKYDEIALQDCWY